MLPIGPKTTAFSLPVAPASDAFENPFPVSPVMTKYAPSTTAYVKVTPNAAALTMFLRPLVTTEDLQVASVVTHKIADATSIAAADGSDDATDRLLANELKADLNVHMASTAYHDTADTAITTADATSDATLIALTLALDDKWKAHSASTTVHGGLADAVMLAAVVALNLAASPSKAQCRTYLNALKPLHAAHLTVTDQDKYLIHAAGVMPLEWRCLGSFFAKTDVSGHSFVTQEFRSS